MIRGKKIYAEMAGSQNAPALLYIHGGLGSCYDFMLYQKPRLSKLFYVIGIDQRGSWRSEATLDDEEFGLNEIVEDFEALRQHLKIDKWTLLSHSLGSYLSLAYAQQYPESIHKLVFESPVFDSELSFRSLLLAAAEQFSVIGKTGWADECRGFATGENYSKMDIFKAWVRLGVEKLGDRHDHLYIYGENKTILKQIYDPASFSEPLDELQKRTQIQQERLEEEGKIYESAIPSLRAFSHPALIIKGKYDPAFHPQQEKVFLDGAKGNERIVKVLCNSGHHPKIEEPDEYANVIKEFLQG